MTGTARYLKEKNKDIKVIMPDPYGSIFHDKWAYGKDVEFKSFEVEGVGKDSIPSTIDLNYVDHIPRFNDKEAFMTCLKMKRSMGLMVGGSSGGNVHAAIEYAQTLQHPACIVVILCDSGTKYLSTIYNDTWIEQLFHN